MSDQFIGQIQSFGFNFAPKGWMFCNGQLMSIAQNTALFSLLGTTYGGDGISTFALPNLQGRVPRLKRYSSATKTRPRSSQQHATSTAQRK